jgi:acetyl-CoA synthetase
MLFDHELAWVDEKIYKTIYENSIRYPNEFWRLHANDIFWQTESSSDVFDEKNNIWLNGWLSNVCYNCVDRHAALTPHKPAIIWHGDEVGERVELSYLELLQCVVKIASILRDNGIGKEDVVCIHMPMDPKAIAAILACARIGDHLWGTAARNIRQNTCSP